MQYCLNLQLLWILLHVLEPCVLVHVCIHVHVFVLMHTYIQDTYTHPCIHTHTRTNTSNHASILKLVPTCHIHTSIRTHIRWYAHLHTAHHLASRIVSVARWISSAKFSMALLHTHLPQPSRLSLLPAIMFVCVCVCVYIYIYIYMNVAVHVCIRAFSVKRNSCTFLSALGKCLCAHTHACTWVGDIFYES
jgi:hypothetical protein